MRSFSINQWCAMHGVSRSMFYKLQTLGKAPETFRVGSVQRISEEANRAWIAQNTVMAGSVRVVTPGLAVPA